MERKVGGLVLQLRPREASFADAVLAFQRGEYARAISILDGSRDARSALLTARAFARDGQFSRAFQALMPFDLASFPSMLDCAEHWTLGATLCVNLGDFTAASRFLFSARAYAFSATSSVVEIDYYYAEAQFAAFAQRDYDAALASAREALSIVGNSTKMSDHLSVSSTSLSRARVQHFVGLISGLREQYSEQLRYYRLALNEYNASDVQDVGLGAFFARSLAYLVRDFSLTDDAACLRQTIESAQWPSDLNVARFDIRRALGWSCVMQGDHLGAFREFRIAAAVAPTLSMQIIASSDRAYLSRELGETTNALEELSYAADVAETVDWNSVGEERMALLLLAQELAHFQPVTSRRLLEKYRSIKSKVAPNMMDAVDRRPRAYERMAEGTILLAEGESGRAIDAFREAYEIWNGLGYDWRAATVAVELAELTNDSHFLGLAKREGSLRPNSWLARRCVMLSLT